MTYEYIFGMPVKPTNNPYWYEAANADTTFAYHASDGIYGVLIGEVSIKCEAADDADSRMQAACHAVFGRQINILVRHCWNK